MSRSPANLSEARGTCANCAHWEANEDGTAGFCLRFPPLPVADDEGVTTIWPITDPADRCGEHLAGQ